VSLVVRLLLVSGKDELSLRAVMEQARERGLSSYLEGYIWSIFVMPWSVSGAGMAS
jgi:hypothetical protein